VYPRGIITQFFGNFTRDAVKKFQCAYGIICFGNEQSTGYGRVGPKTKAQLNKLITDNSSFVPRNEYISKNLSQGMRGEEVMKLQTFLVSIQLLSQEDITQNFDIKFQCANNIICSQKTNVSGHGIVGPKTRAKINEIHSLK
jgi:peptidoglycan hydrolase-like protein with peptidoglycan-binding domain